MSTTKTYECHVEKVENPHIFESYRTWRFFNRVCIYGRVCLCALREILIAQVFFIKCTSYLVINIDYENILSFFFFFEN